MRVGDESLSADLLKRIAERFEFHAKSIYGSPSSENSSPLYAHLALEASKDTEILALVAEADFATQLSNLLFAAVQFLLIKNPEQPLAAFYPNFAVNPKPLSESYPAFRAFCLEHADAIQKLVTQRRVQTNEVGRCAGLLPAFQRVDELGNGKPLALVEIGASAGLLLLWDSYGYHYEGLGQFGDSFSEVQIDCRLRGQNQVPLSAGFPVVGERLGLEIHPINLNDDMEIIWLEALIWPEHADRRKLLKAALTIAQTHPLKIIAGNAAETLPEVLNGISETLNLCIFHSYTFAQMPAAIREEIQDYLREFSKTRAFFRVSQEWLAGWDKPRIELFSYHQGEVETELLAYTESHGRWIEWL